MGSSADFGLTADGAELERLVAGQHHDPHHLLGAHVERDDEGRDRVVIRGWRPGAVGMVIVAGEQRIEMRCVHPAGVFAGAVERPGIPEYRLEVTYPDGVVAVVDDPYRYWPTLGQLDLHLLAEAVPPAAKKAPVKKAAPARAARKAAAPAAKPARKTAK